MTKWVTRKTWNEEDEGLSSSPSFLYEWMMMLLLCVWRKIQMEIRQQEVPWVKHDNGKHQNKMKKKERRRWECDCSSLIMWSFKTMRDVLTLSSFCLWISKDTKDDDDDEVQVDLKKKKNPGSDLFLVLISLSLLLYFSSSRWNHERCEGRHEEEEKIKERMRRRERERQKKKHKLSNYGYFSFNWLVILQNDNMTCTIQVRGKRKEKIERQNNRP